MTAEENHPFSCFGLSEAMLAAITRKGWTAPTSIQGIALPRLLADEGHLIIKARTGTGKTAAFGIPLIEKITTAGRAPRALILTPTRELALQISREIASLVSAAYPRITAVYGGASIRNQILDLRRGTEIVVGTPGRIMDLQERKALDLSAVDWFILDEADEMLDMGFFEDVEKILSLVKPAAPAKNGAESGMEKNAAENESEGGPTRRFHIGLFSATMPDAILHVIRKHIGKAEILEDSAPEDEKPAVDQYYIVVKREDKLEALRRIIDQAAIFYGLVFCATKVETDELARRLVEAGYPAEAIHGDLSQEVRERTLRRFRLHRAAPEKGAAILVATDVAARGLDIEGLTHVINWDLPNDSETYVHRIGRTGRAGRRGIAATLAQPGERGRISHISRNMERTLGSGIAWLNIPSVKSVMKAIRRRIASSVTAALPEQETESAPPETAAAEIVLPETEQAALRETAPAETAPAETEAEKTLPANPSAGEIIQSPFLAKLYRDLVEKMGAEQALAALVTLNYGAQLDPSRYGPVTEFSKDDFHGPVRSRADHGRKREGHSPPAGRGGLRAGRHSAGGRRRESAETGAQDVARVYVALGRRHGAGARDVAKLLSRAGGVPGRQVDDIEMQEYGAFATLPSDAARRACTFSRNCPDDPVIRPARS